MVFTFRFDFFQLKTEASDKPVKTINVKLLNVTVLSRLPSVIASSVWLIPEVRDYLKRLCLEGILEECENAAKYTRSTSSTICTTRQVLRDNERLQLGDNTNRSQREVPNSFGRNNSRLL